MLFRAEPDHAAHRRPDAGGWSWLLFASAALAVFAATRPWLQVRFESLFGAHLGPPGWQSSAGFTCLCSSALIGVLALTETQSTTTREAVRPASLLLATLCGLVLLLQWWQGPGHLRGVSARWTWAFWLALVGVPVLWATCVARCPRLPGRR